jgi:flagellar biosynthesis anti-sigma factor FlgM
MDIFSLGSILNALKFNKKVESPQKASKLEENKEANEVSVSSDSQDTVTISQEAFLKSSVENVASDVQRDQETIREEKVAQIKEKIQNDEYEVSSQKIADKLIRGIDIYEILK